MLPCLGTYQKATLLSKLSSMNNFLAILCLQDVKAYTGPWPQLVFIGMGGREYSGIRNGTDSQHDQLLIDYAVTLDSTLKDQGLGPDRLMCTVDPEATHNEPAWAARLPAALQFLCGGWWAPWEARYRDKLYFTMPRRLKAGSPAVVFLNRRLSPLPAADGGLKLRWGVNGFQEPQTVPMMQCKQLQSFNTVDSPALALIRHEEEGDGQRQKQQDQQQQQAQQDDDRGRAQEADGVVSDTQSVGSKAAIVGSPISVPGLQSDWWAAAIPALPTHAYELNFVFSDGPGLCWDNNNGDDYWQAIRASGEEYLSTGEPSIQSWTSHSSVGSEVEGISVGTLDASSSSSNSSSSGHSGQAVVGAVAVSVSNASSPYALDTAGRLPHVGTGNSSSSNGNNNPLTALVIEEANTAAFSVGDEDAKQKSTQLLFSRPTTPVAGAFATVYVNKCWLCSGLAEENDITVHLGFNNWSLGAEKVSLGASLRSHLEPT